MWVRTGHDICCVAAFQVIVKLFSINTFFPLFLSALSWQGSSWLWSSFRSAWIYWNDINCDQFRQSAIGWWIVKTTCLVSRLQWRGVSLRLKCARLSSRCVVPARRLRSHEIDFFLLARESLTLCRRRWVNSRRSNRTFSFNVIVIFQRVRLNIQASPQSRSRVSVCPFRQTIKIFKLFLPINSETQFAVDQLVDIYEWRMETAELVIGVVVRR